MCAGLFYNLFLFLDISSQSEFPIQNNLIYFYKYNILTRQPLSCCCPDSNNVRVGTRKPGAKRSAELLRNVYYTIWKRIRIRVRLITSTCGPSSLLYMCRFQPNTHTYFMYVRFTSSYQCGKCSARRYFVEGGRWKVVLGCRNGLEAHTDINTHAHSTFIMELLCMFLEIRGFHVSAGEQRGLEGSGIHKQAPIYYILWLYLYIHYMLCIIFVSSNHNRKARIFDVCRYFRCEFVTVAVLEM